MGRAGSGVSSVNGSTLAHRQPAAHDREHAKRATVIRGELVTASIEPRCVILDQATDAWREKWLYRVPCCDDRLRRMQAIVDDDVERFAIENLPPTITPRDELIILLQFRPALLEGAALKHWQGNRHTQRLH